MQKILNRLRAEPEYRFVCGLQGRVKPTPENPVFPLRTVRPWVWASFDEEPPVDDSEEYSERVEWSSALNGYLTTSTGPVGA
eukprot:15234067-Alexandrium_andersonii.AAC.1